MGRTVTEILSQPVHGYQFRADGTGITCHPGDLKHFLDEVVPAIGMTLIPPTDDQPNPMVSESHGQAIAIIAESHVYIWAQGPEAICIVFSCRAFEPSTVLALLHRRFGGTWRSRWSVERSREAEVKPYILNRSWLGLRVIVHRRATLTERCNVDWARQAPRRQAESEADELDPRWHKCPWCWPAEKAKLPREALC